MSHIGEVRRALGMTARDFEEIKQLHARYSHTVDFGDLDGVVACFAPDGCFEVAADPSATRVGERELRRSTGARDSKGHGRHTILSSMIDGDGFTAQSLSSVIMTRDFGPPVGRAQATHSTVLSSGLYTDDLVKVEGRWLYARRRFTADGSLQMLELLGSPLDIAHVDTRESGPSMSALDHEAIRQLLARYGYTLDFEDYDGFADCFTSDGSLHEAIRQEGRPGIQLDARGREELRQYAISVSEVGFRGHVRHNAISAVIEGDGQRGRVSSYAFVTMDYGPRVQPRQRSNAAVRTTGIFRDEVVKVDGRWLFATRTFRKDTLPDAQRLVGMPLDLRLFVDSRDGPTDARAPFVRQTSGIVQSGLSDHDFEEIRQLFARYSQTLDLGDVEGFASCFAEDGSLDSGSPEDDLTGVHRGREELRRYVSVATEYSAGRVRRSALNLLIDGDGSVARSISYAIVTHAYDDAANDYGQPSEVTHSVLATTGMFFDELVKVDGRWLFLRRVFRQDGLPEVLERLGRPVHDHATGGVLV